MLNDSNILVQIQEKLAGKFVSVTNPSPRRISLRVEAGNLCEAVAFLKKKLGFSHLSTITGVDLGDSFDFLYHLANPDCTLTVYTSSAREGGIIPTLCPVIAGAVLYERELQDMFGVTVKGIPDPRPLVLPDNWPQGVYPLRKDYKVERREEIIPGGE